LSAAGSMRCDAYMLPKASGEQPPSTCMWSSTTQHAASGDPALGGQLARARSPPPSPICQRTLPVTQHSDMRSSVDLHYGHDMLLQSAGKRMSKQGLCFRRRHRPAQQTLCRCLERVSKCGGERRPSHGHVNCGGTAHSGRTGATAHARGQSLASAASRKATSVSGCDPVPGMPCHEGSCQQAIHFNVPNTKTPTYHQRRHYQSKQAAFRLCRSCACT